MKSERNCSCGACGKRYPTAPMITRPPIFDRESGKFKVSYGCPLCDSEWDDYVPFHGLGRLHLLAVLKSDGSPESVYRELKRLILREANRKKSRWDRVTGNLHVCLSTVMVTEELNELMPIQKLILQAEQK